GIGTARHDHHEIIADPGQFVEVSVMGVGHIGIRLTAMEIAYFRRGEAYSDVSYTHYADLHELARVSDYLVVIV
ncbi:hypothetical protein QCD79_32535, partial [Pseudomonas quasicaspiana]|nr:hypothetical protein [Pseudomonas quasicaspiana]